MERYSAAACAAGSTPRPLSRSGLVPFFLCQSKIRLLATSHASSFVRTSHKPSLAKIRHSSSLARGKNMTSGIGMIQGLRYLSPADKKRQKTRKQTLIPFFSYLQNHATDLEGYAH